MTTDRQMTYDDLLMNYACGVLDESLARLVAAHLTLSAAARQHVRLYESVGGCLMDSDCAPVAMNAAALQAVLSRLDCPKTAAACKPCTEPAAPPPGLSLPQPLCRALAGHAQRWRGLPGGAAFLELPPDRAGWRSLLLKMRPGCRQPPHSHRNTEITLILEGSLRDENGTYRRGDILIMKEGTSHRPVADAHEGCLCYVASAEKPRATYVSYMLSYIFFR